MVVQGEAGNEAGVEVGPGGLAGLLVCGLFVTVGLFSPGLVLPQIEREFATTPNAPLLTELVGTLASFAFAIGAPFAGMLIARHGCRKVILPCLIGFAVMGALPAMLNDLWLILACRAGMGLSLSGIFTGGLAGIGALRPHLRARAFGWFSMVSSLSAVLLFPLVGALGHSGWRPAFLIDLSILAAVPLVMMLPVALGKAAASTQDQAERVGGGFLTPAMAGLFVISALTGMAMVVAPIYAPLYLVSTGITDTHLLAIPATLGAAAAAVASAAYGMANRRLGSMGVSAAALPLMGLAMMTAGMSGEFIAFTCAIIVQTAMVGMMAPNINACALAVSSPGKEAQIIGLANGVMLGSQLLFPFIAASLRQFGGLPGVFVGFGAIVALVGLLTAGRMRAGRRRSAPV